MASLTNVMNNYRSISTELAGRLDLKTTATSLADTVDTLDITAFVPTGSVIPFAGAAAPQSFLLCDGSAINRFKYGNLFKVIGITYGAGDGMTTFNLPNLKGKIPVGFDVAQTEFDALGETGGEKTHTLTIPEMPAHDHNGVTQNAGNHTHVVTDPGHNHAITDPGHSHTSNATGAQSIGGNGYGLAYSDGNDTMNASVNFTNGEPNLYATVAALNINSNTTGITNQTNTTGITNQNAGIHQHVIDSQGGSQPHNNLQPYIVLNYIIKY